ncbi:MAG: nucleotidyltransferase family protein [Bauldia sp.]|nr:nucleotidyltransferase family protein [Bauldia sp.]
MTAMPKEKPAALFTGQTIRDALVLLDTWRTGAVVFLGANGRVAGLVTDGDLRRALIQGRELTDAVSEIWTAEPQCVMAQATIVERHELLLRRRLKHLIVLDDDGRFLELQTAAEVEQLYAINPRRCPVVVMAGGLGTRLLPLTEATPKPMLMLGREPLLERILKQLIAQGFQEFFFSVRYLKEQIIDYFGDGDPWGVSIRYLVEEDQAGGTGGALALLPELRSRHLLVLNGDLLTDIDFRTLIAFHDTQKYAATMVVREVESQIPYGVVRVDGSRFLRLEEKPKQDYFINAGIYALDSTCLTRLPGRAFDMPNLFARLSADGSVCGVYEHRGDWIDIGTREQLERARARLA